MFLCEEFDPGSELTLVACITHASRTVIIVLKLRPMNYNYSGKRVSNVWIIYLKEGDSLAKVRIIPHNIIFWEQIMIKGASHFKMSPYTIS